jgi:hypothetical protein
MYCFTMTNLNVLIISVDGRFTPPEYLADVPSVKICLRTATDDQILSDRRIKTAYIVAKGTVEPRG